MYTRAHQRLQKHLFETSNARSTKDCKFPDLRAYRAISAAGHAYIIIIYARVCCSVPRILYTRTWIRAHSIILWFPRDVAYCAVRVCYVPTCIHVPTHTHTHRYYIHTREYTHIHAHNIHAYVHTYNIYTDGAAVDDIGGHLGHWSRSSSRGCWPSPTRSRAHTSEYYNNIMLRIYTKSRGDVEDVYEIVIIIIIIRI